MPDSTTEPTEATIQSALKDVMAAVATPVSIVTASDSGRPYGTTVSAFASLSMAPPMVLVSLDRASETLQIITATGKFGLNVLGDHQQGTALSFAGKGGASKFVGTRWELEQEVPRIYGSSGWIACTVAGLVEGGDHIIVLGQVAAAESVVGRPLVYHSRTFGTHLPS